VKLAFLMFCGIATALVVLKQANIVDLPLAQLGQLLDKII
jgi:hypothetical protein